MLDHLISLLEAPQKPTSPKPPVDGDERKEQLQQQQQKRQAKRRAQVTAGSAVKDAKKVRAQERARKTREAKRKVAMKAAAAENKKTREQRKAQAKAGKQLPDGTIGSASPVGKKPADMVPAQIRHCMLALKHKRGKSDMAAWNICRWAMTKYGYLKGPYRVNTKLPKATRHTSKGQRRTMQHSMEKGPLNGGIPGTGATKARKFDQMFKKIEKQVMPRAR